MRIVDSTNRLFLKNYLRDFLTLKRQALFEEIASLDEDPLLTTSLEDLCDQLVNEYTLSAPQIDESGIYSETGDAKVVGSQWFDDGRNLHYDPQYRIGTTVTVYVPFTGIPELFECHPFTATDVMPPRAFVRDSELAFEYQTRHVEGDGLKQAFDRDLNSLRSNLAQIAHDLEVFNSSIQEAIRQRIPARHKKLLQDRQIAESLGFPTRRATYVADALPQSDVEPDVAPQPPAVSTDPETPQPSSEPAQFTPFPGLPISPPPGPPVRPHCNAGSGCSHPPRGRRPGHARCGMGIHPRNGRARKGKPRMRDLFKKLDGWETLIVTGSTKGTWRLNL